MRWSRRLNRCRRRSGETLIRWPKRSAAACAAPYAHIGVRNRSASCTCSKSDEAGGLPMIGRLNHVAIAVRDIAAASRLYRDILGAEISEAVPQPEHGVTTVFI